MFPMEDMDASSLRIDWQWKSETPTISKEQAPPLSFSSVIANSDLRWLEWIRKLQKRLYYSCRKFLGVLAKVFLRKVLLIPSKILKMLPAKQVTGESFYTLSKNIFFLQPARAEILLTPPKNINVFWPIRREFFKPSHGIFSSFSQPGHKTFHTSKKY